MKHSLKGVDGHHRRKHVWRNVEKKGGKRQKNKKNVKSEKKGSHKGRAEGLADTDKKSRDSNLDIGPKGELKDKKEGGKSGMEMGKSKKPPIDLDLMAFVLSICPLPSK